MIRILHITDFHLNANNLRDWEDYVRDAMVSKLDQLNKEKEIDLIACTGDQLDKGGKDFDNAKLAFDLFDEKVFTILSTSTNIPKDRFFFIPGNHDVVRSNDSELIELGSEKLFESRQKLSDHMEKLIKEESFEGMERIREYKEFEKKYYNDFNGQMDWTVFGSAFKFEHNASKIGICGLNNSWRCYGDDDRGKLLIGEKQLIRATKFINECNLKIALVHHPLDGLSTVERKLISEHIHLDFDILLLGHSHETVTTVQTGLNGSLLINLAPSGINDIRSDSRTFSNGFTVIDYDKTGGKITCEYWRYNHYKKAFVLNTDEGNGDNGKSTYPIVPTPTPNEEKTSEKALENIREDHFVELDDHLMGSRADISDVTIKEGFIFPPISRSGSSSTEEDSDELVTLSQIIKSKSNLFFFGGHEAGKTALLFRLIREYVDEYEFIKKIPVYIDLNDMGNKEIRTCIKDYLRLSTQEVNFLIDNNKLVLFIDNLDYDSRFNHTNQTNKIQRFSDNHEEIKIIATGECDIVGITPQHHLENCNIPFRNYFIKNLRTREIKNLMKVWIPEEKDAELKFEQRIEKLVNTFESYALPSTAMSVSLFIWSTEYSDKEPINSAVLLEIYIEIILEKLSPENIYRKTFDFTNKIQLLASIAQEMFVKNEINYSIKFSEFAKVVEEYLEKKVGFEHDPHVIIDYFLNRKIFVHYKGDRLKFSNSCFFHFFLAKRMIYDSAFKEHVMSESEYFKFYKEIDYYTGLTRSDKEVFETILDRFEKAFESTDFVLELGDIDEYFTPKSKSKKIENKPIVKDLKLNVISENRPSEQMLEEFHDRRLEQIEDPNTIIAIDGELTIDKLLIIMSNVLRNSEGVEDLLLKERAYNSIVKYSMAYMILHKESLVQYVIKNNKLPPSIPLEISLVNYLTDIPLFVQYGMLKHLGTPKLNAVIKNKIRKDQSQRKVVSDIEHFLSVALYSDLHGKDFPKEMKTMIKKMKTNRKNYIVCDYTFHKLIDYYYRRTREGSPNEDIYLDLLAELQIRSQGMPKAMRLAIIKSLKDAKKKFIENK